jgi:hypothetical protein
MEIEHFVLILRTNLDIQPNGRGRGQSFASSSSSFSPGFFPGDITDAISSRTDFPFNINEPPPQSTPECSDNNLTVLHADSTDQRLRGDSISSANLNPSHSSTKLGSALSTSTTIPSLPSSTILRPTPEQAGSRRITNRWSLILDAKANLRPTTTILN